MHKWSVFQNTVTFVIAWPWVVVKFGINTTSVALKMRKVHEAKSSEITNFQYNKNAIYTHAILCMLIPYLPTFIGVSMYVICNKYKLRC